MMRVVRMGSPAVLLLLAVGGLAAAPVRATLPASTVIHSAALGLSQVTGGMVTTGGTVFARGIRAGVPPSQSCVVYVWSGGLAQVHSESTEPFGAAGNDVERTCGFGTVVDVSRMLAAVGLVGDAVEGSDDSAVALLGGGAGSLVLREGDPAPGGGADTFVDFIDAGTLAYDGSRVAFVTSLTGDGVTFDDAAAIFHGAPGAVAIAVRKGDATTFGTFGSFGHLRLGPGGGFFTGSTAGFAEQGIFSLASGATPIAVTGQTAPGSGTFDTFSGPEPAHSGEVAFWSRLADFREGIFAGHAGALRKVALTGDPAPDGSTYDAVGTAFTMSPAARVAFSGSSGNHEAIFAERPMAGTVVELAREGDAAPGLSGLAFAGFTGAPLIDAVGRVTFKALLTGPGVGSDSDESLWMSLPDGELRLIAREGDQIVAGGALRTIEGTLDLPASGSLQSGRPTAFTPEGQVIYIARFSDDSEALMSVMVDGGLPGLVFGDGFESGDLAGWN